MTKLCPLTYFASSLARYSTACATSSTLSVAPLSAEYASKSSSTRAAASTPPNTPSESGVASPYGDTQFTRTPNRPSSAAAFFISPSIPCFDVTYACVLASVAAPKTALVLAVMTMHPRLRGTITRAACFVPRKDPVRFTASTCSKRDFSVSARGLYGSIVPALLCITSSPPKVETAASTASRTSDSSVTSQRT
ncbi:hypothetical protein QJS10_CPB13g01521 [Acorus calamus]|uniref:Uncharacterized protein n=1 Tax=Acorus calamus TaxID=4465 RepID=A0AAV9DID1_ACOCL|nr:hypothetical protein QJS10_CPB13g01521 [Acorus calamus]